jgi:hypothetical protein
MLAHHDSRPYALAAQEAVAFARTKLERLIEHGRDRAASVLDHVISAQPLDRLVRAQALTFHPIDNGLSLRVGSASEPLHPHALRQAASRVGFPWTFGEALQDPARRPWGGELLAHNLNRLFTQLSAPTEQRFLLRSLEGQVRGFLSDRFRRLDSRPIVEAFAEACGEVGALPVDGHVTDTRISIEALLPNVYEPVENEVMAFGVVLENSDFGAAALSVRSFCLRVWCTNRAIAQDGIREVHLGGRLADELGWSDETYRLDTETMASAVRDVVKTQLGAERIETFQKVIQAANEKQLDPRQVGTLLRKRLTKHEVEKVQEAFEGPEIELLPPGRTAWRLSNAVSWVAGQVTDADRKIDLMKVAGALLPAA